MISQLRQSPDTNLNDLGFFAALQSRYYKATPRTMVELIAAVEKAYEEYPPEKINRLWLTYMGVLNKIIDTGGNNNYDLPHLKKEKLE